MTQEQQAEVQRLKEENQALKKKLDEKSNGTFNKNLRNKSENILRECKLEIARAIGNVLKNYNLYSEFDGIEMTFAIEHGYSYDKRPETIAMKNEENKKMVDIIERREFEKFQASLDNFSWAVKEQSGHQ